MVETLFPGVYVQELPTRVRSIEGVSTSTAAFVGAGSRSVGPVLISSVAEFERAVTCHISRYLAAAVRGFFENGGRLCRVALSDAADPIEACLDALTTERLSMLCCPEEHDLARASEKMVRWCERRGDAICILQSPAPDFSDALPPEVRSSYAACYHPWLRLAGSADEEPLLVPPAGARMPGLTSSAACTTRRRPSGCEA
jgi:hypothetical protein